METTIDPKVVQPLTQAIPWLLKFPAKCFWVHYDAEADVLYISFRRPQQATDTEMTDDGILWHYRGKDLAGISVLDASTRSA